MLPQEKEHSCFLQKESAGVSGPRWRLIRSLPLSLPDVLICGWAAAERCTGVSTRRDSLGALFSRSSADAGRAAVRAKAKANSTSFFGTIRSPLQSEKELVFIVAPSL